MKTADLCDAHPAVVQVAEPLFSDFGGVIDFAGPAVTLKVFEDNSLVRQTLLGAGNSQVLVIDGGGSLRCALLGGNLAALAQKNGWAGLVINGCIRDSAEIIECQIGVKALATHPQKSLKRGEGQVGVALAFADIRIEPGHWIYADEDGLVVSPQAITA